MGGDLQATSSSNDLDMELAKPVRGSGSREVVAPNAEVVKLSNSRAFEWFHCDIIWWSSWLLFARGKGNRTSSQSLHCKLLYDSYLAIIQLFLEKIIV